MSEVIFGHAGGIRSGKKLKAFAPSGPSSGYLPASMVEVKLDFKALADAAPCSAPRIVFATTHLHVGHGPERVKFIATNPAARLFLPHGFAKNGRDSHWLDAGGISESHSPRT